MQHAVRSLRVEGWPGAADELSVDECLVVARDLIQLGCRRTTLIGGEVFLYQGWEKIARASPAEEWSST